MILVLLMDLLVAPSHAASASIWPLTVTGSTLDTASGSRFIVKGVTQYWYAYNDSGSRDPAMSATSAAYYANRSTWDSFMAGQGLDLVRIGLGAWEYDDQTYLRRSSYVSELQSLISTAADNGLTVELGNWDSMGDGARITHDYSAWHSFWLALKPVIETNRNVIVEPFNEPNGISESKWLSVWEKELNFWRHQMKYPGVIVVDTNDHSSDFSMSAIHELTDYADRLGGNILFSIHSYATEWPSAAEGFVSGMYSRSETDEQAFNSRYTAHEQSYPILIDETGNANGSPGGDYNAATSASGPSPNYWLWLTQFHSAMASDVLDDGLNGEIGFAFSWSRGDCMITYCYGAGGHAWNPAWNANLGPDIRELLCEAVLATTLVRRELNLVATHRPHVVENALEQSIQWSRGPTDPVVRSRVGGLAADSFGHPPRRH